MKRAALATVMLISVSIAPDTSKLRLAPKLVQKKTTTSLCEASINVPATVTIVTGNVVTIDEAVVRCLSTGSPLHVRITYVPDTIYRNGFQ